MASTRVRLTTAYAAALIGTLLAVALAIWLAWRADSEGALESRVARRMAQAVASIRDVEERGDSLTIARDTVRPRATPALRSALEGVQDYVLVLDRSGRLLYNSFDVRQLHPDDQQRLQTAAIRAPAGGDPLQVQLSDGRVLIAARSIGGSGDTAMGRLVVGAAGTAAERAPPRLLGTMLLLVPLILLASIGSAYLIAGNAFQPVDRIINEVEAITDGRSLHRRLPVGETDDEIARLTATLNAMMTRLERSFGALRRFTADASHELKTPLTVLRADVERAMHSAGGSTEQLVSLEEALRETRRMADLVDSLLTLARADEGRLDLHREPVELEPLVREVYETAVILGEDAGLHVLLLAAEHATVPGDRTRLRQLFLNLVTNAIKYTPRGGRVELSLSRQSEDTITFTVRDSGVGISAGDLPHIFERFYRADRARSRHTERGGFGLGLAISQWIVQAHGGTITVSSRLGRGSTFIVSLPLGTAAAVPQS